MVDPPRLASPAERDEIEAVTAAAYEKYLARTDKPPAPLQRDYGAAVENGQVWVIGQPVEGLVVLERHPAAALLIENVAVHPSRQGSGLGRRLMEFAEVQARARDISRLVLYTNEVMTENPSFYEHLGFSEFARRAEDGYRRIYMEKHL